MRILAKERIYTGENPRIDQTMYCEEEANPIRRGAGDQGKKYRTKVEIRSDER